MGLFHFLTNSKLLDPEDEITKIFENSEIIYPTTTVLEESKNQITHKTKSLRKYSRRDLKLLFTKQQTLYCPTDALNYINFRFIKTH